MRSSSGQALSLLRERGDMSRAELARTIGISPAALTKLASILISNGAIADKAEPVAGGVGRPASMLTLVPGNSFVVGVHFGVGRVGVVITDAMLRIRARDNHLIDLEGTDVQDLTGLAVSAANRLIQSSGVPRGRIRGIGVGVPGRVDPSGRFSLNAFFSPNQQGFPFADLLEEQLALPVLLSHNVTAMALAEALYGAGKGLGSVLNLYLRRGLGAGLVERDGVGQTRNAAVELGHIRTDPHGKTCFCGGTGCLETVLSEKALLGHLGLKEIPQGGLLQAAMADAAHWQQVYAQFLGVLATAVTLLEPDVLLLSGHLGEAPTQLLEQLRRDLPTHVMPQFQGIRIEHAVLQPDAGALGAACIGLEQFVYQG